MTDHADPAEGHPEPAAQDPHLHVDVEAEAEEDRPWSNVWRQKLICSVGEDRCPAPLSILMSACHKTWKN